MRGDVLDRGLPVNESGDEAGDHQVSQAYQQVEFMSIQGALDKARRAWTAPAPG
jgi:hypothetical protein